MAAPRSDSITIDQLGRFYKRVNTSIERSILRACRKTAKAGKKHAQNTIIGIKPFAPIDQKILIRGYKDTKLPNGARLENYAKHAAAQEFGTSYAAPPFDKILQWAARKAHKMPALKTRKTSRKGKPATGRGAKGVGKGSGSGPRTKVTFKGLKGWRKQKARSLAGGTWKALRGEAKSRYDPSKKRIGDYVEGGQIAKNYHAEASQMFPAMFRGQLVLYMNVKAAQTNRYRGLGHVAGKSR